MRPGEYCIVRRRSSVQRSRTKTNWPPTKAKDKTKDVVGTSQEAKTEWKISVIDGVSS